MKCNNRTVPHQNFAFWCGIVFGKVYGWWGNRLLQSLNWPVNPFWRIMLRLGWCELALQPDAHDWVGDCYAVQFYSVGSGDFWQVDRISEFIEREAFFSKSSFIKCFLLPKRQYDTGCCNCHIERYWKTGHRIGAKWNFRTYAGEEQFGVFNPFVHFWWGLFKNRRCKCIVGIPFAAAWKYVGINGF